MNLMKYAILERRRNQYWNGKYTNISGYTRPRLTGTVGYRSGAKTIREPKLYTTCEKAQKGLEAMWNNIDDMNKHNFDFTIVEYEE